MQTNLSRSLAHRMATLLVVGTTFGSASLAVFAQQTTTTSTRPEGIQKTIQIDSAQVIYVSGDNVVLRNSGGGLQLLTLSADATIPVDGKPVAARDLRPGTQISHVHVNSVQQSTVTEVTQIDGTVLRVLAPNSVILRLGDGTVNRYTIPPHATFQMNGQEIRSSDLRRGMSVSATVVRTSGLDTQTQHSNTVGSAISTPPQSGILLVYAGKAQ